MHPTTFRLLLLLVTLPIMGSLLVYGLLHQDLDRSLSDVQSTFGHAMTRQLSENISQLVVEGDMVSLNVVATRLVDKDPIEFVAIFDDKNQLVAQSGRESRATDFYSAEVTFQDSLVGFTRVGIRVEPGNSTILLAWLFLALGAYAIVVWRFSPALRRWLNDEQSNGGDDPSEPATPAEEAPMEEATLEALLVIRIRPAHHLETNFERFYEAARLYGGLVEQTTPEELVIHYEHSDALFMAACGGLLIRQIAEKLPARISFGATLDIVGEDARKGRKSASYLASISNGDLIIAGDDSMIRDRVKLESFHHSLVESGDLLRVTGLSDESLIDAQAMQLLKSQT